MRREKIIWKLPPVKKAEGRMEELYTHIPIFSFTYIRKWERSFHVIFLASYSIKKERKKKSRISYQN